MLGIISAIALSWLLLYVVQKNSILALGLLPIDKRLKQFIIGFLISGILCVLVQCLEAYLKSSSWVLNEDITGGIILKSFWWCKLPQFSAL